MSTVWIVAEYGSEGTLLGIYSTKELAVARLTRIKDENCLDKFTIKDNGTNVNIEDKRGDYQWQAFECAVDQDTHVGF